MDIKLIEQIALLSGSVIALFTFIKAVFEYTRQNANKRVELYLELRRQFKENEKFRHICDLLDCEDPKIAEINFKDRRDFAAFFETIALMTNTGILREDIAHYMFGYSVIQCWNCEYFWKGFNRGRYWSLLEYHVKRMEKKEKSFKFKRRNFRL